MPFLAFLLYFCLYPLLFSLFAKVKVPKLTIALTVVAELVCAIFADRFTAEPIQLTVWAFVGFAVSAFVVYFLCITFTDVVDKKKPEPENDTKYLIAEPCIFLAIFTTLFFIVRAMNF